MASFAVYAADVSALSAAAAAAVVLPQALSCEGAEG